MSDPILVGDRGETQDPPRNRRTWLCSDCTREADDAEQHGLDRPVGNPVRSWTYGDTRYFGALCERHERLERCRAYLELRRRNAGNVPRLAELDAVHDKRAGRRCVCADVLRRDENAKPPPLHPCSSNCGRMLAVGVGRCFTCSWRLRNAAEVLP